MTHYKLYYDITILDDVDVTLEVRFTHYRAEPNVGAPEEISIDSITCAHPEFTRSLLNRDDMDDITKACWEEVEAW